MPRKDTTYPGAGIDLAVQIDGQLVVATVEGSRVRLDVEGEPVPQFTDALPAALMPPAIAVAPDGRIAVAGRTDTGQIYGCLLGRPWVYLGPANTRQGVAWKDGQFVWARVVWSQGRLYEQTIEYDADGTGREVDLASQPCDSAGGVHYFDTIDGRWLPVAQRETPVGPFRMLRPVRRPLNGGIVYCGQVVGSPDYQAIATTDGTIAFRAAAQIEMPTFVVVGDRLVCVDRANVVRSFRPPYPVETPAPSIPKIGRPLWLGWYRFGQSPVMPPGNCEIRVVQGQDKFITTPSGRVIAAYAEGVPDGDINAVDRAIAALARPGLTVAPYWTRQAQKGRLPRGTNTVVVEAYRLAGESIPDYEARVTSGVRRVGWAWLAVNVYTSNPKNHQDLPSVVPVIARIAKANTNVVGILGFSAGTSRASGWDDHPEVHDDWRALYAGITSVPSLPTPTPKPPAPTPPAEIDMPKMTYDEGLAVVLKAKDKWRSLHRPGQPANNDVDAGQAFHWAWRALYEGWSEAKILEDVK